MSISSTDRQLHEHEAMFRLPLFSQGLVLALDTASA